MNSLEKYQSIMSQTMLQTYLGIIENLKVDYKNRDILKRLVSTYPDKFDTRIYIDDPIVALFLLLRDTDCSNINVLELLYSKMNSCKILQRPKLVRKISEENINDVMARYLQTTPKRIVKSISNDDISDISRRSSIDSMASPVVNY